MNKQEKEELITFVNRAKEDLNFSFGICQKTYHGYVQGNKLINYIEHLYEPQKVKVPAAIDQYIRKRKSDGDNFHESILATSSLIYEWYMNNAELYEQAWVNGYEVEKEPLYTVTINLDRKYHLVVDEGDGNDEISTTLTTSHGLLGYRYFLTEKEIKSADENLWLIAVPVEEVVER